jgi:penicillin-binding protein 1A
MVTAYSTLAARGDYRPPFFVTRVTDKNGNVLAEFRTENKRVMSETTVKELVNMLRDAVDKGTGQAIRARFDVRADVAGKTGTTQKNTDGWFILMHPRLVAGAWVGFNDSRVTMRSNYWGEGGHNAVLVVGDFFKQALDARLIDGGARFPYERPHDSFMDPYVDKAKEWLLDTIKGWFGGSEKPAPPTPRREIEREPPRSDPTQPARDRIADAEEQRRLERQQEKQRLLDLLKQKMEQRERQQQDPNRYRQDH